MSHSLTPEQTKAVAMLASGQSIQAVVDAFGKSCRSVERWQHNVKLLTWKMGDRDGTLELPEGTS